MALVKATIEILDAEAIDPSRGLTKFISVQFNPTEYGLEKGAQIAEVAIPGIDSPILQFVRGQTEKLTLELFFDTTDGGTGDDAVDVRTQTRSFYQLVKIQPKTHAPPRVRITWGRGLSFKGVVESVNQKFLLFNPQGVPLRATLTVAFKEYKTLEEQLSQLNLQSSDKSKRRIVKAGETLAGIAAEEYQDPREWRRIAEHEDNAGVLPSYVRLIPGTSLVIPPI